MGYITEDGHWKRARYSDSYPDEGAVPFNTCLLCGVGVYAQFVPIHERFHVRLED